MHPFFLEENKKYLEGYISLLQQQQSRSKHLQFLLYLSNFFKMMTCVVQVLLVWVLFCLYLSSFQHWSRRSSCLYYYQLPNMKRYIFRLKQQSRRFLIAQHVLCTMYETQFDTLTTRTIHVFNFESVLHLVLNH